MILQISYSHGHLPGESRLPPIISCIMIISSKHTFLMLSLEFTLALEPMGFSHETWMQTTVTVDYTTSFVMCSPFTDCCTMTYTTYSKGNMS